MVHLYKTPLSEYQWTNALFFHVYAILYSNTSDGGFWWSIEKVQDTLILQMSREFEDVKHKIEGENRISERSAWYWEPQFIMRDAAWKPFTELYEFIIVDTDPTNIRYRFSEANCREFAKIIFNRVATNRRWNYII